jgi:hypothetical protein
MHHQNRFESEKNTEIGQNNAQDINSLPQYKSIKMKIPILYLSFSKYSFLCFPESLDFKKILHRTIF